MRLVKTLESSTCMLSIFRWLLAHGLQADVGLLVFSYGCVELMFIQV